MRLLLPAVIASIDSGYKAAQELFNMSNPPTAVFAVNDHTAIGALILAKERGIAVPEEVAIVGWAEERKEE